MAYRKKTGRTGGYKRKSASVRSKRTGGKARSSGNRGQTIRLVVETVASQPSVSSNGLTVAAQSTPSKRARF